MRRFGPASLRMQMLVGAGGIALLALCASAMMIYGARATSHGLADVAAAERRMELLGALSARINDYAIVAIDLADDPDIGVAERRARLDSREASVARAFSDLDAALSAFVGQARGETESNRRATRSLDLARMRARFQSLARSLAAEEAVWSRERLRPLLDGFATQFSPLLDAAIAEERRVRAQTLRSLETLRGRIVAAGLAIAAATLAALALFQFGLIAPLFTRIDETVEAARRIGAGQFRTRLPRRRRDEFGLLFAHVNRMAARLDRRERRVEADRARLGEIVAARTAALSEANAELERIDANRRRFFSDVSHELRTPLTVILGETGLGLRADPLDPEKARAALEVIDARARRLNRRIDDLLRVARSEGGRIALDHRPFDLNAAAREALSDIAPLAQRRNVSVQMALAPDPLPCLGDPDWIRQVIDGLFDNAIRHSAAGARLRLATAAETGHCALVLTDEGPGVAADELPHLFERFRRGARGRESPGFGVGLSLARWIVDEHSGTVSLDSPAPDPLPDARGPGVAVALRLPRLTEAGE